MAKTKLDWFKLDCFLDENMELIESEFGLTGFAIIVRIWQKIYGGEGYYCRWDRDIELLFAKRNNVSVNVVSEVVKYAIIRGIFDSGMFEKYGILTSHGIQARYYECASRRKGEKIKDIYLLRKHTQNAENDNISSENVYISDKNVCKNSQNRIEENRIDEIRGEKEKKQKKARPRFTPPTLEEVKNYCNERKNSIDPQRFIDYYTSNGWKVGKNAMKDWKAAVRTWERRDSYAGSKAKAQDVGERSYSLEKWHEMYDGADLEDLKFEEG